MESLSALRDMYFEYNKTPSLLGNVQKGGGGANNNTDTDSDSEEESWRTTTVNPENQINSDAVKYQLIKSKSEYYNTVMPKAPTPLDQDLLLNTIIETDLLNIANVLINAISGINQIFSTSLIETYNRNNGKDKLNVDPELLNQYRSLLSNQGMKCINSCRASLRLSNLSNDLCKQIVSDIFITYVYSFANTTEKE